MPVVLMNGKPRVLLGDWDWGTQSLKVNNSRFSMENERLVVHNAKAMQTHELKRAVSPHDSDGVWFHERKGELIIADDGKRLGSFIFPSHKKPLFTKQNGNGTLSSKPNSTDDAHWITVTSLSYRTKCG